MSKETRKQRKQDRKLNRATRKKAFKKLIEAVKTVKDIDLKDELAYKDRFNQVWPTIKPVLEFAVILKATGEKFDRATNHIIIMGDNLVGGEITDEKAIDFLAKLASIWDKIEMVLELIKIITDDEKDEIIDKIIEMGEWLFD